MNNVLRQGESAIIEVPVFNADNTTADLTGATNIKGAISIANQQVAKYSLNSATGYGTLIVKAGAENVHIAQLLVTKEQSQNFATGFLKVSLLVSMPDPVLTVKVTEYFLDWGTVAAGILRNESI